MAGGGDSLSPALEETVSAYLDVDGVKAAGLITADGLLVANAGDRRLDWESLAAHAASALASMAQLAGCLDAHLPGAIGLNLAGRGLIMAPLTSDLILVLVGEAGVVNQLAGRP